MIITIDGPLGSGKSTLSTMLAKELHFFCLNSGYLYRGMAYVLKTFYRYDDEKLQNPDIADVQACIDSGKFRYEYKNGLVKIFFEDDITQFLKDPAISKAAAILAQNPGVRDIIRAYKRTLVQNRDVIAEGRVCGSAVFPDADLKLYVVASDNVRAKRVQKEQIRRGNQISEQEALELVVSRDKVDMNRKYDPLIKPKDAVIFDTSNLSKEQMLQEALKLVYNLEKK